MTSANERRKARELALQISFQNEYSEDLDIPSAIKYFSEKQDFSEDTLKYAVWILEGLKSHKSEVDSFIDSASANWKISRMALVDLSILRVATLEIHFSTNEVPKNVAINEALEVAKKFGSTESTNFINGVLDQIASLSPN